LPAAAVVPLTKDPDVLVRRAALRALGVLKEPATIPAIEAALLDSENSVRWQAALVLGQLNAPQCLEHLFEAVARSNSSFQFNFRAVPTALRELKEKKLLTQEQIGFVIGLTSAPEAKVREVAWSTLRQFDLPRTDALGKVILKTLASEPDPYARELALAILRNFPPTQMYMDAISRSMKEDSDAVVQVCACRALATIVRQDAGQGSREKALQSIVSFFRQYGEGCQRTDKAWGWRDVGNAVRSFGEPGNRALNQIMHETQNKGLAELAWRVVYLKQEDQFFHITEEQERQDHLKHPFLKFGKTP